MKSHAWNYYFLIIYTTIMVRGVITMDILKLCDLLYIDKDLHDIPIDYIFRVAVAVLNIIANGECFYKDDID